MNHHTDYLSQCCTAPYKSICADEGTCHAECLTCGLACNLVNNMKNMKTEIICKACGYERVGNGYCSRHSTSGQEYEDCKNEEN